MATPQMTAKIKSLLLRAWRERWSDIQCSIALNKVLPCGNPKGDAVGLAGWYDTVCQKSYLNFAGIIKFFLASSSVG